MVKLKIDGRDVEVPEGTTIRDAAAKLGIKIPVLCHRDDMERRVGVCRVCAVDVKGRVYAPACCRTVDPNMEVKTHHVDANVRSAVGTVLELLTTDNLVAQRPEHKFGENELETLASEFNISSRRQPGQTGTRFPMPEKDRGQDNTSSIIFVDHNACILCDRCIRGCNDIRKNNVIGRRGKGYESRITFDNDRLMGESSCVACGECMVVCPTGALSHKSFVEPKVEMGRRDQKVQAEELAKLPLFEGVSRQFLKWNEGAVVRRFYKDGDIICREGEPGNSAFYIEQGIVDIYISSKMGKATSNKAKKRKSRRLLGLLPVARFDTDVELTDEEVAGGYIQIDAPVSLKQGNPTASLETGDLFGEQSVLNNLPRSATVRARGDVVALEMLRNVFYILRRSKKAKEIIDARFKDREIQNFFRAVPMFSELTQDPIQHAKFAAFMQSRVELIRLDPGAVVFRQGDAASDFYIVNGGFIKVTQQTAAGERVLSYLGKGQYFGEIALMAALPEIQDLAPQGVRTATCSALDHVNLVKLSGKDFLAVLDHFPAVRENLLRNARQRLTENAETLRRLESRPLADFLEQGLQEAESLLVLDLEKCTRCDECTKACSDSHQGITRLIREGLRFDRFLVASSCRSCQDPYCIPQCPVSAIVRGAKSLEIVIKDHCIGCSRCAEACPYGNINMHEYSDPKLPKVADPEEPKRMIAAVAKKATTCDLCTSYDGVPSCVYACPHDAAHRMPGKDLLEIVSRERLA